MSIETVVALLAVVGMSLVLLRGILALYGRAFIKVPSGQAMIVNKMPEISVCFTGELVIPGVHTHEFIDVGVRSVVLERSGSAGLTCKDGIRADLRASFYLRVNKTRDDVLQVAQKVGAGRAMDPATLEELFTAKFSEALESVAARKPFADHRAGRGEFVQRALEAIGSDLYGYTLDALTIDRLEQTPLAALDSSNILDAEGILAITKSTTEAELRTAELRAEHRRRMKTLETQSQELWVELESRQASALLRLRKETGADLTKAQLEDRLLERLGELVAAAVEAHAATHP